VALGAAVLLRYLWPGFPLLRLLNFFAGIVATPIALLTGQPVVLDVHDNVTAGMLTLLLSYGIVLMAWCMVGGLVGGVLLEQTRKKSAAGGAR
jgi:hypothetical protein